MSLSPGALTGRTPSRPREPHPPHRCGHRRHAPPALRRRARPPPLRPGGRADNPLALRPVCAALPGAPRGEGRRRGRASSRARDGAGGSPGRSPLVPVSLLAVRGDCSGGASLHSAARRYYSGTMLRLPSHTPNSLPMALCPVQRQAPAALLHRVRMVGDFPTPQLQTPSVEVVDSPPEAPRPRVGTPTALLTVHAAPARPRTEEEAPPSATCTDAPASEPGPPGRAYIHPGKRAPSRLFSRSLVRGARPQRRTRSTPSRGPAHQPLGKAPRPLSLGRTDPRACVAAPPPATLSPTCAERSAPGPR